MTLLKGNELDARKAKSIELVLRRRSGEDKFTDIASGDMNTLRAYKDVLIELLSEDLLSQISDGE
jgi:hypothetical protein